jgi:hypothetical protein
VKYKVNEQNKNVRLMCFFLGGTACDAGETPAVHPKEVGAIED